jgi:hypothetical protein
MFILGFKLHQQREQILNFQMYEANKMIKNLDEYYKERNERLKNKK